MTTNENKRALSGVIGTLNRAYEETSARDGNGYRLARGSLVSGLAKRHFSRESVEWALRYLEDRGLIVINRNPLDEEEGAISIKEWIKGEGLPL